MTHGGHQPVAPHATGTATGGNESAHAGRAVPIATNRDYLDWEFTLLREQLDAWVAAREGGDGEAYRALAERLPERRRAAAELRRALCESGVDVPFEAIVRRFALEPIEEAALVVGLAAQLSPVLRQLLLHAQGPTVRPGIGAGFVAGLLQTSPRPLCDTAWLRADAPLVRDGLVLLEPTDATDRDALSASFSVPEHVAGAVVGERWLDRRVAGFCRQTEPVTELFEVLLAETTRRQLGALLDAVVRPGQTAARLARPWTVLVTGPQGSGKTKLVHGLARLFRRKLLTIHLDRLGRLEADRRHLELAVRQACFCEAVLHLVAPEAIQSGDERDGPFASTLAALVRDHDGLAIVETTEGERMPPALEREVQLVIEMEPLDAEGREQLWEGALPEEAGLADDVSLRDLAFVYTLSGHQTRAAVRWAEQRALARGTPPVIRQGDLVAGAETQVRQKLGSYTEAGQSRLTLRDIVLPTDTAAEIGEFLDACRVRQRVLDEWGFGRRLVTGKGLAALFHGEAGTGKTLCAEILASELGLRLHIVSIPKIVSKWVGETEKNLRAVFSGAPPQRSILLFDEADSLFSRRVSVERSQDHYQNMGTNLLLQELERFEGIVILTTNLSANMDKAFERRILFRIEFPVPDETQRGAIWRCLLPPEAPVAADVDFPRLAREYELTGGQIKNAIVRAAYRCNAAGQDIAQLDLEEAARQQASAAGKVVRAVVDHGRAM